MTIMATKDKPGRLTDNKWRLCEIGKHDKCVAEIELASRFEGCPCECHQTVNTQPAPDAGGGWRVVYDGPSRPMIETPDGRLLSLSQFERGRWISYEQEDVDITQIVAEHNAVGLLVAALEAARKYIDAGYQPPELIEQIDAALAATGRQP
jgi:hypothetical protein